ncbi:MAG: DUF814 domain-containing protein [Candidatus Altiarchaeota archaeon]|nr:DUF814 domain-containing protein [Candidatus Altiarchaeota archaeon]
MEIELDTSKSAAKNASLLFSKAKKLDEKVKKAQEAIAALEQKRDNLKEVKLEVTDVLKIKKEREWYEKFRWFYSSTGKLILGGRDATSNEVLLKKYTDATELCFHADISGAPFFVIKGDADEVSIKETAQAAGIFSKAWGRGLGIVSVYYAPRTQFTKQAPSGEYVGKGAFMVYGKKSWEKVELKSAIGVKDGRVAGGPLSAIKTWATKLLVIEPGDKKPGEIVKRSSKILGVHTDEIQRAIPAGKSKFVGKIENTP